MLFSVIKTSDMFSNKSKQIEINTLEELLEFKNKHRYPIIIDKYLDFKNEPKYSLEIYNDWRE